MLNLERVMTETRTSRPAWWRRLARALMPWDQDPLLAVMGALLLLVMVGGALGLLGFVGYVVWDMAPQYPVFFAVLGVTVLGMVSAVWLLRSRCPHCKRFFAARRTKTEVDHAPTSTTLGGAIGGHVSVNAERVVLVRHYRCRRCGVDFTRRS